MFLGIANLTFLDKGPFTFSVEKGECVGITGRSGVGKTQLFRAITDLIPSKGDVRLAGISCKDFAPEKWRSRVTMVPSDSSWWYDRVGEHFLHKGQGDDLREGCALLGLDPGVLAWQVNRLSVGERQRLSLLRTLQIRPDVLLLDEPSSGLDAYHTTLLEDYVEHYRKLYMPAIVWVSHDPEQLRRVAVRKFRMEETGLFAANDDHQQGLSPGKR